MASVSVRTAHRIRAAVIAAALMLSATLAIAAGPSEKISALVAEGRLSAAAERACIWAEAEPGNLEALRACGTIAFEVGRYSRAENALRSLLFYTPNDPDLLVMLGRTLFNRGLYDQARKQFETAIHLNANSREAYVGLARVAVAESADPGDTLSAAEVALSVAPDHAPAHTVMGAALRQLGRPDEALEHLKQARAMAPGYPPTVFEMGLSWALLAKDEPARRAWERFVQLAPCAPQAWLLQNGLVVTRVKTIMDRAYEGRYSPDGSRIAYRSRGPGGWVIYTIPAQGEPIERKVWSTENSIQDFAWSPDGTSIAVSMHVRYEDDEGKRQWTRKLVLIPTDGGEVRELMEDRYARETAWNPATGHLTMPHYKRKDGWRIVNIDPETGDTTPIPGSEKGAVHYTPCWSSDGSKLLAQRRTDRLPDGTFAYDLVVAPADDFAGAKAIFRADSLLRGPTFTPDGSVILFAQSGPVARRLNIWALPADGSREPVLVDNMAGPYGTPSISPDGRSLLTSREYMLARVTLAGLGDVR